MKSKFEVSKPVVALVGPPNVGKSALFGALTGRYVTVSNYPGTTVEVSQGQARLGAVTVDLIDTPGTRSLIPTSEDERVTRDLLLSRGADAVLVVGDAKNLERAVLLALEVRELAIPAVLVLNMSDEAQDLGIRTDSEALSARLRLPVVATVATRHQGLDLLAEAVELVLSGSTRVGSTIEYSPQLESAIQELQPHLPQLPVSSRAAAVMALAGDPELHSWLARRQGPEAAQALRRLRDETADQLDEPVGWSVAQSRLAAASLLLSGLRSEGRRSETGLAVRLDQITLGRFTGPAFLSVVLLACWLFVGVFGAGTLVALMEGEVFGGLIAPAAARVVDTLFPTGVARDLLVGPYGLLTMALPYAFGLILPVVGTFFLAFGVLEDTGYLPRLAVLLQRSFRRMGLSGKAVLPMVLGLGCDTMATLTTRVLETKKERLVVTLLLALGVPCSAQLGVVLALMAPLPASALVLWLAVLGTVLFCVGRAASWLLPGEVSDFILELPPLRLPRAGNLLVKTAARIEWYLREAVPLFFVGTLVLFLADRAGALKPLQESLAPVLWHGLGLPKETAEAFLIGFLRRDFGAAGLFQLARNGALDPSQVLVASVTLTLFLPCIANLLVIIKERGGKAAFGIAAFVFPFALAVGSALHFALAAASSWYR